MRDVAKFGVMACIAMMVLLLCGQYVAISSLHSEVTRLQDEVAVHEAKVLSYSRSYCSSDINIQSIGGTQRYNLESAGLKRSYLVHSPKEYDPSIRYPVILSFDGMEGSASRIESYSGINTLPVIAVYPEVLPGKYGFTAWQGASYAVEGSRDMQFVKDLLDTLPSRYCVDSSKIFTVGMSNGGGFAALAGCELSDKIRAVASVSGAYYTDCAKSGQRTPSLMVVHSKADKQVPFLGAKTRKLPDLPHWVERKAEARNCQDRTRRTDVNGAVYYSWFKCKNESILRFVVIDNQDHGWLQVQSERIKEEDTASSIWRFFEESIYAA